MILSNDELKKIYFGALRFEEKEGGFLQGFQYTAEQMAYFEEVSDFWFERSDASTAKTLEFCTEAKAVSFEYKIVWKGSEDSVELMVNNRIRQINYIKDMKETGTLMFELPEGRKDVVIYLPADATMLIRNFTVDAEVTAPVKNAKVLWLGDSITQGFGPLRSSCTYVSVANRLLQYDIINQGIGGYVYDKNAIRDMNGYRPDKIIIAMGTNQYGCETMDDIEAYYEALAALYGPIPVLSVIPLWRGDNMEGVPTLEAFCAKLKKICEKYSNITIVEGWELVPHLPEYFLDNLHPNQLGCEVYGRNLVEAIRKSGF